MHPWVKGIQFCLKWCSHQSPVFSRATGPLVFQTDSVNLYLKGCGAGLIKTVSWSDWVMSFSHEIYNVYRYNLNYMYLQNYMYWYTLSRPSVSDPRLLSTFWQQGQGISKLKKKLNLGGGGWNIFSSPIYKLNISFLPYFGKKAWFNYVATTRVFSIENFEN